MTAKPGMRSALTDGGALLGTMVFEFATLGMPRLAAAAGADFVIFDLEHTGWGLPGLRPVLAAARSAHTAPIVRAPALQRHLLAGALDLGARGVMVPMVANEHQAREIAQAARFPPAGKRGYGVLYSDDEHPDGVEATMRRSDDETLVIAQVETAEGVEHVDAIAAEPGIDVVWIGHYDLSISLGVPGEFEHPTYLEAAARVVEACRSHEKAAGMLAADADTARRLFEQGFRCLALGADLDLYQRALSHEIESMRDWIRTIS
ncbi:MAG: aldolase/citrate lyase family protein [Actinobacteria bacterium]|nr:aldolase/citrate lyase family protein [Actinomycetota bacterium]